MKTKKTLPMRRRTDTQQKSNPPGQSIPVGLGGLYDLYIITKNAYVGNNFLTAFENCWSVITFYFESF